MSGTIPAVGTGGVLAARGVTLADGSASPEQRATYGGRVASPWVTLDGVPLPDLYVLDAADGERYVFESPRVLLSVWTPDAGAASGMRPAVFSIEGDSLRPSFEGLTTGRTWNGWDVPWFARAAVDAMLGSGEFVLEDGSPALRWAGVSGTTLLEASEAEGPTDWRTVPSAWVDGVCYWNVGDGWIWLEVDDDDDDDAADDDAAAVL